MCSEVVAKAVIGQEKQLGARSGGCNMVGGPLGAGRSSWSGGKRRPEREGSYPSPSSACLGRRSGTFVSPKWPNKSFPFSQIRFLATENCGWGGGSEEGKPPPPWRGGRG